jgi:heme/copper-type cytochrome/quinol oxidase subunit 4
MIDPRGPRFAAALTTVVLAVVLVTGSAWLLAAQTVVFAVGAFAGLHRSPYGVLFRRLVRPRLAPPAELEDAAAPRFAQLVGFGFALVGTVALVAGATVVGQVAVAAALAAAFLNAAFGFCLGCEVYLIGRRVLAGSTPRTAEEISA